MQHWLKENWIWLFLNILIPVITWVFSRRHFQKRDLIKKDTDISSLGSDIISKNLTLYQKMLDDVESRYEKKLEQRDAEIKYLEIEIENLKKKIEECIKLSKK